MDDILIIDDFLPQQLADQLENIITNGNFTMMFSNNTAINPDKHMTYLKEHSGVWDQIKDDGQFVKMIHYNTPMSEKPYVDEEHNQFFNMLIWFLIDKHPELNIKNLHRCKVNLIFNPNPGDEEKIVTPHVDIETDGYVSMIYYVNDSDGSTVIYNETCDDAEHGVPLTVRQKVMPRKNRAVVFESKLYHVAQLPILNSTRWIINYVLCTNDDFEHEYAPESLELEDELREIEL